MTGPAHAPGRFRSDVAEVLRLVAPASATSVRFADEPPVTLPPTGADPTATLAAGLRDLLYGRCYSHRIGAPAAAPAPDPLQPGRMSRANRTRERWDVGWQVYRAGGDGAVGVAKGDRQRSSAPGEYLLSDYTGQPPRVGAAVTLRVARESFALQPGFYHMFGEVPGDVWDDASLIRFYFGCTPDGVLDLIAYLTDRLNRFQVPYRMKALTDAAAYTRTDAAVLYCARRYYPVVARIVAALPGPARDRLRPAVPLFAKPLAPGIAVADDPGDGQSFGMDRCGLLAGAIVEAWLRGATEPEARLAVAEAHFRARGLSIDAPYLRAGLVDVFAAWERGAEAA